MADETPPPYDAATGAPSPVLAQMVGGMQTQEGQDWAVQAAQQLQTHITGQAIAQNVHDAGNELIKNVDGFKQGATSYVAKDPTAIDTVLGIIPHTIDAISQIHPEEGERASAASALTDHIQNQVVMSGVRSLAANDRDAAHAAINKYRTFLSPDDVDHLTQYTNNMAAMRQADYEGQQRDALRRVYNNSDAAAIGHLSELAHPDTGQMQFPPTWGQRVMANNAILPATRAALIKTYAGLQVNGDRNVSDPDAVTKIVTDNAAPGTSPTATDIIGQVGHNLSTSDAIWLARRTGPQPAPVQSENQALSATLQTARSQIGNANAYGRFVNWFLPAYQRATANGTPYQDVLSPQGKDYVLSPDRMATFRPTGDDIIKPAVSTGARPALSTFFGGKRG